MARKRRRPAFEKPTLETIQSRLTEARQYWGALHADQDIDDQYFNLKRDVKAPRPYDLDIVYPSTGNSIVLTLADHVAGDTPLVKVPEANPTLKARDRSERLEKGYQGALSRFRETQRADPIRAIVVSLGWSGMAVSQGPIFDPSCWGEMPVREKFGADEDYDEAMGEYEARKRTEWPFYWTIHDPRHVFPDPGTHGRKWVIVNYQREVGSIAAQWPEWDRRVEGMSRSDPPMTDTQLVEWVEYWDEHYRAYIVGGVFIDEVRPHRYGKPPFQIRASGLGKETGKPEEIYRSMLFPVRSQLDAEIKTASQMAVIIRNTAWSQILTRAGSGLTEIWPGRIVQMQNNEDIKATRSMTEYKPEILTGLLAHKQSIQEDIEQGTYPQVVKGIKAKGIASGFGQNSLVAQAKVRFGPLVVGLQSLLSEFFSDLARCVENVVQEPVPVWGPLAGGFVDAVLRPEDIDGYYYNVVTVNPKLPTDRATEVEIGNLLLSVGAIDKDTYISDYAGYENPGEMRMKVLRDKIMDSPEFTRIAVLATAMKTGIIDYALDAAAKMGADPLPLLQALGFGVPGQQQMPNTPAPVNPAAAAAQHRPGAAFNANEKTPAPGTNAAVRNEVVPGMSIGG